LQDRLNKIKADSIGISRLKPATAAFGIGSGLLEQTHSDLNERPDTKLIVIDTELDKNIYACDRRDTDALRDNGQARAETLPLSSATRAS
jgi:hypothetical protein